MWRPRSTLAALALLLLDAAAAWDLTATGLDAVVEDETRNTTWTFTSDGVPEGLEPPPKYVWITVESKDHGIVQIISPGSGSSRQHEPHSLAFCLDSPAPNATVNFSVPVKGVFLGYTSLVARLWLVPEEEENLGCHEAPGPPDEPTELKLSLIISVVRAPSPLVIGFTVAMAVFVSLNYVNMGCQLDLNQVWEVIKKPKGPVIGFLCQFIFMPLAAYGVGYLLLEDPSLRLGLFVLGCSPGGSMSNFWTLLFDGDLNLSITMTFVSTVAALGMMPLWIFTLGATLFQDRSVSLPYPNLAASLAGLTLPIGLGLVIRRYKAEWTKFSARIIRPFTVFCIVVGISVGMYANRYIFSLFTWKIVAAGLLIAWGGYTFGGLAALLARLPRAQVIAIAIETAFQNAGVAFVMLMLSLPQPDADLTAVPLVAQLMLTGLPMWVIFLGTRISAYVAKNREERKEKSSPSNTKVSYV